MKLIIWFAKNPIAANFLMIIIIAGGALGLSVVDRYTLPPAPQNQLEIDILYPNAGPSEVEQALCIPIEEAIYVLEGIKNINSFAMQGKCELFVEFDPAIGSATRFQTAVQAKIDAIPTLPKAAEGLKIEEVKTGTLAVNISVRGEIDVVVLQRLRDQLRARLGKHPDIGMVHYWPQVPYEMSIEITESDLRRYALSFEEVSAAIQNASKNLPAGELKKTDGSILLRSRSQAMTVADFAVIELRPAYQGTRLLLGDVAQIRETVGERDAAMSIDGKRFVSIYVMPKNQIKATVDAVNQVIEAFRPELPEGVDIITWEDWSVKYDDYMNMLIEDAISGFILVFLILMFTLRFYLALWVSSGILISLAGAFWMMPVLGISLNAYSISALILILGVVADDAIIVGENIYTHQQQGRAGLAGAISGTLEVMPLVVMMVLSTMIAFIPGLFLPGLSGNLMYNISMVIIVTLMFSMLEALLILPSHLAVDFTSTKNKNAWSSAIDAIQKRIDAALQWFINHIYLPTLQKLLHLRYITLTGFIVMLMITGALVESGHVPSTLEAPVNDYYLIGKLEYPAGTPFAEIEQVVARLKHIADEMRAELNTELGVGSSDEKLHDSFRYIVVIIEELESLVFIETAFDERMRARVDEIKKRWQERFGEAPPNFTVSFQSFWPQNLGMPTSQGAKPIELKLIASDPAQQSAAGEVLKNKLASYSGVHSISSSMKTGKPELRLRLKPEAAFLGLTMQSLTEQVSHSFGGLEVQRFFQDQSEVRVMLRFPAENRRSLDNLYQMPIKLPGGGTAPFANVAETEYAAGFSVITRQGRERIQLISAEVYKDEASAEVILAELRAHVIPELEKQFPGLRIEPGQARQKQEEAMTALWGYGALAMLAIYALLAIPLRSYTQPLLIMLAIPFGFIGAVVGHLLWGISLTLESYVGLFAVGGIVINDSLILVVKINEALQKGTLMVDAVLSAGRARFRAIFLTTATTFIGLLPLLFEQSSHAEKILPMAITLAFGILFATLVTLVLVPISCVVLKEISCQKSINNAMEKRFS